MSGFEGAIQGVAYSEHQAGIYSTGGSALLVVPAAHAALEEVVVVEENRRMLAAGIADGHVQIIRVTS